MKIKAFTLAEVLITLGIIGVVAAMTLPTIINDHKAKELQTRFKKAYSILSNVHQRMINDYGGVYSIFIKKDLDIDSNSSLISKKYEQIEAFSKYFNDAKVCEYSNSYLSCSGKTKLAIYKTYTGNKNARLDCDVISDRAINTSDGMSFFFGSVNSRNARVYIDTNGTATGPNRLGFDLFAFDIDKNDKIVFPQNIGGGSAGAYEDDEELGGIVGAVNVCSLSEQASRYNGFGCSEFALLDKNPDNQNLSYWKNLPK